MKDKAEAADVNLIEVYRLFRTGSAHTGKLAVRVTSA
jgi:hypothetical protein